MTTYPPPQRALRGHRPPRPTERTVLSAVSLARLAARLTPRDRWLAHMLYEHRVLTSHQIAQLAFVSHRAANLRLLELYKSRVVERFQPFVTSGTAPMHYVLDIAGARLLPPDAGTVRFRQDEALAIAQSLQLTHLVGSNSLFTALVARARHPATTGELTAWWSESRCRRYFGDLARPDGYGRWREGDREVEWFLEHDTGTEAPAKVADKVPGYAALAATTRIATPILFWLPTARREGATRRALLTARARVANPQQVPIATTNAGYPPKTDRPDPTTRRWLPLESPAGSHRYRLADLPAAWPELRPLRPDTATTPSASVNGSPPPHPMPPPATSPGEGETPCSRA
ncbi:replication-relaxation family protein [Streptomyces boninensis]|uniref:replication-relaxation family protein n=1 Tax=Streptomyces boninensis TaxID=2039455 RepID=UPI003B224B2E